MTQREPGVKLEHIVVATDASEVGRGAYAAALDLAARASARVTVMNYSTLTTTRP
jgi:hypothetical protein